MPSPLRRSPLTHRSVGIIVPSANIVVERAAIAMLRDEPGTEVHFARVPVRGAVDPFPDGYDVDAFEAAADLLADAASGAIVWAGSKGVLVGIDRDEDLKTRIEDRTGLPFTSSALALRDLVAATGLRRIGLVTPYTAPHQQRLIAGFKRLGLDCADEAHADIANNLAYAAVGAAEIRRMATQVATSRPEAILTWCTNFASAECLPAIERDVGLPVYDATLLGLRAGFRLLDRDIRLRQRSSA